MIGEVRVLCGTIVSPINRIRDMAALPRDLRALFHRLLQFRQLRWVLPWLLANLRRLLHAVIRFERTLEHCCEGCKKAPIWMGNFGN
jgi:hypothetical protein